MLYLTTITNIEEATRLKIISHRLRLQLTATLKQVLLSRSPTWQAMIFNNRPQEAVPSLTSMISTQAMCMRWLEISPLYPLYQEQILGSPVQLDCHPDLEAVRLQLEACQLMTCSVAKVPMHLLRKGLQTLILDMDDNRRPFIEPIRTIQRTRNPRFIR